MSWFGFRPYVSVAERRRNALREIQKMEKKGHKTSPVRPDGRAIATTFWGKSWCDNLESYSDFSNRLPRGRTYLRNGSVVDLQIAPGKVDALVSGSSLYRVTITIAPVANALWKKVKCQCAGGIGSLVELLQGKLSSSVMQVVTARDGGLFPKPKEITMSCSCPDYAGMCKHVAAVLYGVGTRLDEQPDLLFKLREVDHMELISEAGTTLDTAGAGSAQTLAGNELADVFGIELEAPVAPAAKSTTTQPVSKRRAKSAKASGVRPAAEVAHRKPVTRRVSGRAAREVAKASRKVVPEAPVPKRRPRGKSKLHARN